VGPAIISLTTLDLMTPRAARYYLTGETFGAAEAAELGLITLAAPDGEGDAVLDGLLTQIRQTSPQASAETKKILNAGRRQRIEDGAATISRRSQAPGRPRSAGRPDPPGPPGGANGPSRTAGCAARR
jgi:enoyl-CoA hydratase